MLPQGRFAVAVPPSAHEPHVRRAHYPRPGVDTYEGLLSPALPMANLQPIDVFMPSEAARQAALRGEGAKNSGPLSGVLHGVAARSKGDAPRAGQLQGDRATLFLSN